MNDFKNCPNCDEKIKLLAKKCRFCNTWLNESESKPIKENILPEDTISKDEDVIPEPHDYFTGNKKSNIILLGLVLLCGVFYLTMPSKEKFELKINQKVLAASLNDGKEIEKYNPYSSTTLSPRTKSFLDDNYLDVEKNFLWSTAILINQQKHKKENIGFGILGIVFLNNNINAFLQEDSDSNSFEDTSTTAHDSNIDSSSQYKLIASSQNKDKSYYLEIDNDGNYFLPRIIIYNNLIDSLSKILDYDMNLPDQYQAKVTSQDNPTDLETLDLNEITDYFVKGENLYFIGYSTILRSGIYTAVQFNLNTNQAKAIAYGTAMKINKAKSELEYEQYRLTYDAGYEAGNEYEEVYLRTKLN